MAKPICGVYMIRNKQNNKVYIGQSRDVHKRWRQYVWAAQSNKTYGETKRPLINAMRREGVNNFIFSVVDASEDMLNSDKRYELEFNLINEYRSYDPAHGYNLSMGYETVLDYDCPRHWKQDTKTRIKRAKPVFLYDTIDDSVMLYVGGAKAVGDDYGYSKDVMSHTVKRGSLFMNRFYLIPVNNSERADLVHKLRKKKVECTGKRQNAKTISTNAFNDFMKAVEAVERHMREMNML